MARACRELKIPVISGNVSLYNETRGEAIYPTAVVGMVGLIEDVARHCTSAFKNEGDYVFLIGEGGVVDSSIGSSEYLELVHGIVKGNPHIDLDLEKRLQRCCLEAIKRGLINSAHDCSEGGLAVTLAESSIAGSLGFVSSEWEIEGRLDAALFGEAQSRIVVSTSPKSYWKLIKLTDRYHISAARLGVVGGNRFKLKGYLDLPIKEIEEAWRGGLEKLL
jgi:phosphoribosylformylglycinamidine (FGAM) synthase-like enzyme